MNSTDATAPAKQKEHPVLIGFLMIVVAACFFMIGHDFNMPLQFQEYLEATSVEELENVSQMFETTRMRQIGGLLLGAVGILLILQRGRSGRARLDVLGGLLVLFLAWNTLSVAWAEDPALVVRRLALLAMIVVGAVATAQRLTPHQIMTFVLFITFAYIAVGIGNEIYKGTFTPFALGYRFAGTLHPNNQAINCALFFLVAFGLWREQPQRRMILLLLIAVALVVLYITRSRTAFTSALAALILFETFRMRSWKNKLLVFFGGATVLIMIFVFGPLVIEPLQEALKMGRTDVSEDVGQLTGRRALWTQLMGFAGERPVLGYGYGGFWTEENSRTIMEEQGWPISHAHNGYLDVLLEAGPLALVVFVSIILIAIRRAFLWNRITGSVGYEFMGVVLTFTALNSLLESQVVQRTFLAFIVGVVLVHLAIIKAPAEYGISAEKDTGRSGGEKRGPQPAPQPARITATRAH